MVFVSIGLRLRTEVEALNMVEALGAYVRHRTVSILRRISKDGKTIYKVVVTPAISGQSIAYGYHKVLVELAKLANIPVCDECRNYEPRGGFHKRTTQNIKHDKRIEDCVVEDLTGFLAPEANVRRTSPVSFSYLVPDLESSKTALDPQFHVRYNFETNEHAPFNIESGTAIYMLSIAIDVDKIGKLEGGGYVKDRLKRIELALKALSTLIEGVMFGAKKARYLPIIEVVGGIAAISNPIPFTVTPPRIYRDGRNYIDETIRRANVYAETLKIVNEKVKIVFMDKENVTSASTSENVRRVNTLTEMIEITLEEVKKLLT